MLRCVVILFVLMLGAAAAEKEEGLGYVSFYLDNDLFGSSDQDYTNGWRLSWISPNYTDLEDGDWRNELATVADGKGAWGWWSKLLGFEGSKPVSYNYGVSVTQLMFTPQDLFARQFVPDERPYAGWLSLAFSLHAKDEDSLNSIALSFGVVGEYSYAQEAQDSVHDLREFERFHGWDNQIPTELTLNLFVDHKDFYELCSYEKLSVQLMSEWGGALGNFKTNAYLGAILRAGYQVPVEFSDPRLTTSAYTQRLKEKVNHEVSCYFIGGGRSSAIAHDITLDGPVLRNFDIEVKREPWVHEVYAGVALRFCSFFELAYLHNWRSQEFEEQDSFQDFGSISLRFGKEF